MISWCHRCIQVEINPTEELRSTYGYAACWQARGRFRRDSAAALRLQALPTLPVLEAALVSKRLAITERAARNCFGRLKLWKS